MHGPVEAAILAKDGLRGNALHAELKPRLDRLAAGDVHGRADKPYGRRELLVLGPVGNPIAFGQAIATP